ncbi:MAG TPA: PQQ-dependent sugar dehydrogenase [Nocardioidaceae bacterium]|nr:PQQ-dependent sugar dehydrogenase [Nocardioidaceae bacterium]
MKAVATTLLVLLALASCTTEGDPDALGTPSPSPQPTTRTVEPDSSPAGPSPENDGPAHPRVVGTVARGLAAPWGIVFLPDGTALVSERDTTKVLAIPAGGGAAREVGRLEAAQPQGEAGLLGLEVSPTYDEDSLVYAYFTTATDNRVVRMTYDGRRLGEPEVVLDGIPASSFHDGGRLEFGPDGYLYISTGEIGQEELAQDRDSLGGKILRITPDGEPAPDNPRDGSPVWTMGHRNVQGLAFDDQDRLWASEFGSSVWDELNRIERGRNYGWPLVEGRGDLEEYRNPFAQWRTSEASPSGLAYAEGALWMASLRGQRLWRVPVHDDGTIGEPRGFFVGDYGRLRTVVVAPDGSLWLSTSNRDGRGDPAPQDDRILRVALR